MEIIRGWLHSTCQNPDAQIGNPRKKRCMVNDRTDVPTDDSLQMNHSNRGDDSKELTRSLVSSIAIKRQQNTLAARRSCAKKQEHIRSLEQELRCPRRSYGAPLVQTRSEAEATAIWDFFSLWREDAILSREGLGERMAV
ncbi:hypothetical protein BT69DRAFT_312853 [Atractiella rhizophila]|nr:hypothetical protein BT69DRAFT_312853 [Atractiella rhizophila]